MNDSEKRKETMTAEHAEESNKEAEAYELDEDELEQIKILTPKAEQGDVEAQFNLGELYLNVFGEMIDKAQAFFWFTKAAEQGHAEAQYRLGECYSIFFNDMSAPKDDEKAIYWFTEASNQNHKEALFWLEAHYER
jgi:hypothetical protein